jgi:hypothetical protein
MDLNCGDAVMDGLVGLLDCIVAFMQIKDCCHDVIYGVGCLLCLVRIENHGGQL